MEFLEEWRSVEGFEDRYKVSNTGLVFSIVSNRLLTPKIDKYGYKVVSLCRNGKSKHIAVHRLVATAFIPNPYNLPTVNHKDENKLNNHVSNLEWLSIKDNDNYGSRNERMSNSKKVNPIAQYDTSMTLIKIHLGIKDAQRTTGVNRNSIRKVCRGERLSAGGYVWRYYKEVNNG